LIFVTPRIVTELNMAELEKTRLEQVAGLEGAAEALSEPTSSATSGETASSAFSISARSSALYRPASSAAAAS